MSSSIPRPLLDNLRYATFFYNDLKAQNDASRHPQTFRDAQAWVLFAGMAIGNALIDAEQAEAPHA
jgi:hypothetical protein